MALASGETDLPWIAEALGLSPRTLQRRLGEDGTSHAGLLDDIRAELALEYLDLRQRDISEVAAMLGFSGPAAFARAYRRWTGHAPTGSPD